jgi:hypothetical protein
MSIWGTLESSLFVPERAPMEAAMDETGFSTDRCRNFWFTCFPAEALQRTKSYF